MEEVRACEKMKKTHSLSSSKPRKPFSFFKLMLQPTIQFKNLSIPEMFARTYGDELSTAAILTVPTQESWKVGLVKEDDKLWFHDGWHEFVEYFSIGYQYFLQFIYEGDSKFEVHIFDLTACEISYPFKAQNSPQGQKKPGNDDHNEVRFTPKKQDVSNNIGVEVCDVIKLESDDEHMHDDDDDCDDEKDVSAHSNEANDVEQGNQSENLWSKDEEALDLAGFSKPENPFFISVIKERHLQKSPVYVPAHFGRAYLRFQVVGLEAPDGRHWQVQCTKLGRCSLSGGWIYFARDNSLKGGDVCVFELIDAKNCILKVHIIKK